MVSSNYLACCVALAIGVGLCGANGAALGLKNGEPLYIHCNLTGTKGEGSQVEWIKDNDDNNILTKGSKYITHDHNNTLQIIEADPDDAGTYECRTTSAPAFTKKFFVYFFELLEIEPKTVVEIGEYVTLTCATNGKPLPTLQWKKDGQKLDELHRLPRYEFKPNEHDIAKAVVSFRNATKKDEGVYSCRVFSDTDVHNITTILEVVPKGQGPGSASACGIRCFVSIVVAILVIALIALAVIFKDKIRKTLNI